MSAQSIQELRGGTETNFLEQAINGVSDTEIPETTKTPAIDDTPVPATDLSKPAEVTDPPEGEFKGPFDKKPEKEKTPEAKPEGEATDFEAETAKALEDMNSATHPGEAFKKVRGQLKTEKATVADLQKKIEGYESGDITGNEKFIEMKAKLDRYDEVLSQNETLSAKIAEVDYRETAEYQDKILKPYEDIAALADSFEDRADLTKGEIMRAVTNKNYSAQTDAIEAMRDKLDDRTYNSVMQMANEMTVLYQREDSLSKNSEALLAESRTSREAASAQEKLKNEETYKRSVNSVFDEYQDKIPLFIADDGTESPLSKDLKIQASTIDFDTMNADQKAFASMSAVSLAPLMRKYNEVNKQLAALSAGNRIADASTPRSVETGAPAAAVTSTGLREGETPKQAIDRIMNT
tara:strand:- start:190 stop:1413 length:1224 start_codon:yes stop_codon:yes gene_type:complete